MPTDVDLGRPTLGHGPDEFRTEGPTAVLKSHRDVPPPGVKIGVIDPAGLHAHQGVQRADRRDWNLGVRQLGLPPRSRKNGRPPSIGTGPASE